MTYLIKKWYLPKEEDEFIKDYTFKSADKSTGDWLENLSKVNIFVGPNNSGKSRFMRHLISLGPEKFSPVNFDLDSLLSLIKEFRMIVKDSFVSRGIKDIDQIYKALFTPKIIPLNFIESGTKNPLNVDIIINAVKNHLDGNIGLNSSRYDPTNLRHIANDKKDELEKIYEKIIKLGKPQKAGYSFNKIYIPTLRGLRPLSGPEDVFEERTVKDYFKPPHKNTFTGLSMFFEIRKHLLGDLSKRRLIREFEKFLGDAFFERKEFSLIPREDSGNDVIFVKIGNEKEFPIFKLGDGIQQLIIIAFPLFINKGQNILLFIEEPELYLHPGLQRILLEKLTSNEFGCVQTFLTTHSNHFLDLSLDYSETSIYKFTKEIEDENADETEAKFFVESTSNKDHNVLEQLGVRNSSVLLTNCTIWVEGITDRLYIRKYLEEYQNDLKKDDPKIKFFEEDRHYSFVEYSGNNIKHWSFLDDSGESTDVEFLCGKLFLISDRDKGKEERHEKLKGVLGDRYYPLECLEIENLLTYEVLKKTIGKFPKAKIKENVIISYKDYKGEKLGEFIDKKILQPKSGKKFKSESGSINCKLDFAKKAVKNIKRIDDMSDEAKELAEKIYNFIKEQNK